MQKVRLSHLLFAVVIIASLLLASCTAAPAATTEPTQPPAPANTQPPAPANTQPPAQTPKPTPPPPVCDPLPNMPKVNAGDLGSPDKPITMAFVPSGEAGKIAKASTDIADCLSKMTGLSFQVQTGTSYAAAIEAMGAGKAQVGFLNTFSILIAEQKYGVIPVLANLRNYATNDLDPDKNLGGQLEPFYKGQFITRPDTGIKSVADLKGKTFCFVDPNSTSGYIIPRIIMKANGIDPDKDLKATQNAGSHPNVAIAVYKGDCDAGITFINVLTDKAADLQSKYPDITDKVVVFADTDRIPNDGVQVTKDLNPEVRDALVTALLAMSKDPGGKATLASLYTINAFEKIDASFYDEFAALLKKAGVDPASMVK